MHKPLALELRPKTFKEFIYNEHIVFVLQAMLEENMMPNGIMFSGIRGIGKTTLARLVAKTLNCKEYPTKEPCNKCESCLAANDNLHPDIREIDGATHGNIEDIRRIIDEIQMAPMVGSKKIFIIDEAHNLGRSTASWDALLKVLEEPPPHILWVFCTTQKNKIPETIKSRLISLDLKAVPTQTIADYLCYISEALDQNEDSAMTIARAADNSIRDALTILEKISAYCADHGWDITTVSSAIGAFDTSIVVNILHAITQKNAVGVWAELEKQLDNGVDPNLLFDDGIVKPVNTLMSLILGAQVEQSDLYMPFVSQLGVPRLQYIANTIINRSQSFIESTNKKLVLQILSMELCA